MNKHTPLHLLKTRVLHSIDLLMKLILLCYMLDVVTRQLNKTKFQLQPAAAIYYSPLTINATCPDTEILIRSWSK